MSKKSLMRVKQETKYCDDENFEPEWLVQIEKLTGWKEVARAECREDAQIAGRALADHYGCELVIEVET